MNPKLLFICILLLTVLTSLDTSTAAGEPTPNDDPSGYYAITYTFGAVVPKDIWMQKQLRDGELCRDDKIFVAGIFQDTCLETITILQPMRLSEATAIMNDDPVVKAKLCKATVRYFAAYAPALGQKIERRVTVQHH